MAWHRPRRTTLWAATAASASLVTTLGLGALPASASGYDHAKPVHPSARADLPSGQLSGPLTKSLAGSKGRHAVFVQLTGRGAADAASMATGNKVAAALSARASISRTAAKVFDIARAVDTKTAKLFVTTNTVPGIALNADSKALLSIVKRSDVVKVSPLPTYTVSNASAAQLTNVLKTWRYTANTGKGVKIGVIDTGLDFTHADFGGTGTTSAYDAALADSTDPSWHASLLAKAKLKIGGGYDFVGNDYDADPTSAYYQPVPNPDPDPIDCGEHGTHVAGTAAGYGVNANGTTFNGSYKDLTGSKLFHMRIGPGVAPRATLYSLKVFGCSGSTNAVIPALDWALDPNHDGNFSDHLDIVNLSLGSDYGTVDDPENRVINELNAHGVLPVIAMGNGGDLTDIGGSPGNAVGSLTVASSVDQMQMRDGLKVNAPSDVAGIAAGQNSIAYPWSTAPPVTGDVVAIPGANADGCDPLSVSDAAKVAGKVAWLEWDDNDSTRRCGSVARSGNVKTAGAIGAIFTSSLNVFNAGITGDTTIPVFQLPKSETDTLRPALDAGTLNVTFDGQYAGTIQSLTPSITDTLSSFSSRGTHGSLGVVKPDVTAPGDTITSALMGSGSGSSRCSAP
jgi:subtilisin family serine protease